jgi:hypothetical protein
MVTFGANYTVRNSFWTGWKAFKESKSLLLQYDDDGQVYTIWGYDGPEVFTCTIYKGTVPDGVLSVYSQEQNDLDKSDFETNYKPTANRKLVASVSLEGVGSPVLGRLPTIAGRPVAPKLTFITPNWCDKTTWYCDAVKVENEVATDSGDHTTYSVAHENVIDVYHGKITFEEQLKDGNGNNYLVVVKVNDVVKAEQDPHYGTGGDYTINYAAGEITFLSALQAGDVVKVTYHYARKATFIVKPETGKRLYINSVEVQFSEDIVINDSFIFQAYGLVDVFAPQLMLPPYNIPSGTKIPLGDPLVYKTMLDFLNDSNSSHPSYPAVGGSGWRALKKTAYIFTWEYAVGTTCLVSSYGMEIHIDLQHDSLCGGSFGVATLYCTSEDEE